MPMSVPFPFAQIFSLLHVVFCGIIKVVEEVKTGELFNLVNRLGVCLDVGVLVAFVLGPKTNGLIRVVAVEFEYDHKEISRHGYFAARVID